MEVLLLLDMLEESIAGGKSFFGKKTIDKEKAIEIISEIRLNLPDDLKKAEWISKERQKIIYGAEEEAKEIIAKAHIEAKKLVERDVITETAKKKADRIIKNAEEEARKLKNGAINFSREILSAMTTDITKFLDVLLKNNEELKGMIVEPKTEEKEKKGK